MNNEIKNNNNQSKQQKKLSKGYLIAFILLSIGIVLGIALIIIGNVIKPNFDDPLEFNYGYPLIGFGAIILLFSLFFTFNCFAVRSTEKMVEQAQKLEEQKEKEIITKKYCDYCNSDISGKSICPYCGAKKKKNI